MLFCLNSHENIVLEIGGYPINVINSVNLLRVNIDAKLKFNQHIAKICKKKINNKISAFSRVSNYLDEKQSLILYSFIRSQFNYCPLIWMSCGSCQY